ncbi:SRPBCC family protein [Nonomuraea sp. C10]|uniref:SRPBCC family protein n=1 Tax=Nonomuraea sp. C10 TaxID=2600577 RepID=UPI0011CDC401|nr:SRPBCC family protein [Nonomuraea sp. C10]TXK40777.1 SRPBCC family protein [Nonomuraea sp. C10]
MTCHVYAAAQVFVPAPPERVFALVTDWPRHREWMVLTSAWEAGDRVEAFTGVGRLGFLDVMTITRWEPPHVVEMRHVGRLVRGDGVIRVRACAGGSRVIWAERLRPPLGPVGWLLWPVARPVVNALARLSLRRLARLLT